MWKTISVSWAYHYCTGLCTVHREQWVYRWPDGLTLVSRGLTKLQHSYIGIYWWACCHTTITDFYDIKSCYKTT